MPINNLSINYTASLVAGNGVTKGDVVCIVPTDPSQYVLATAANRANCKALALCIQHRTPRGTILIAYVGQISAADCGLGPGVIAPVRVSAAGRLERLVAAPVATDEIVGWADTSGNVSFSFPSTNGFTSLTNYVVDNMTALRALPKPTSDHVVCQVLGYYTIDDKSGGLFYWDSGATDADDNGMFIQANAGGNGRWIRIWDGIQVNVKWWGAYGDGAVDDTIPINAAFTFAQAYVSTSNGLIVYFPTGVYYRQTTGNLLTGNFITVKGDGPQATVMTFGAAVSGFYTNVNLLSPTYRTHYKFEDFGIQMLVAGSVGFNFTSFNDSIISNVRILAPNGTCISMYGDDPFASAPQRNHFSNLYLDCDGTGTCIALRASPGPTNFGYGPEQNFFTDIKCIDATTAVVIEAGRGNTFFGFSGSAISATHFELGTAIVGAEDTQSTFIHSHNNVGTGLGYIIKTYTNAVRNVIHLGYVQNYDSVGGIGPVGVYDPASVQLTENHTYLSGQESANLSLYANTKFLGTFTHTNTANRTYTLQDASGTVPLMAAAQADSVAAVLADLVTDFNALLAKLRVTKVINT